MPIESEIRSPLCAGHYSPKTLFLLWSMRAWHGCPCGPRHVQRYFVRWLPPAAARIALEASALIADALGRYGREPVRLQHPDCIWLTAHETFFLRAFEAAREGSHAVAFYEAGQFLRLEVVMTFVDALARLDSALEAAAGLPRDTDTPERPPRAH